MSLFDDFTSTQKAMCKRHGKHSDWRVYTYPDSLTIVQCRKCALLRSKAFNKDNPIKKLWYAAKGHAKSGNREFNIEIEDIANLLILQNNKCALSGIEFDIENNRPSLDRIDSSKGYTKNNIQLILININKMKTNLTQEEFINYCRLITGNLK